MNKTIEAARDWLETNTKVRWATESEEGIPPVELNRRPNKYAGWLATFSDQQNAELKAEVEKLREQLEAAKVALEKVDGECPYGDCSCKLLHTVARKALARIEEDK
jgi:hypothetical protein